MEESREIHEFGPLSPQDVEKAVQWLNENAIQFRVTKDQASEDQFKSTDGINVVRQTELRTSTYLAQIFYLQVENLSDNQVLQFQKILGVIEETLPISFQNTSAENSDTADVALRRRVVKQQTAKRFWAWILVMFIFIIPIIWHFFDLIKGD